MPRLSRGHRRKLPTPQLPASARSAAPRSGRKCRKRIRAEGGASWQPRSRSIEQPAKQVPGYHDALNLGGAFADLADFGVPHHALDRIILGVAVTAMDLDRLDRRAHRKL